MGYLGGPNFPDDPTDLGPLVDLPGGFAEIFEYLAGLGYRGFEFFQFSQNVNELGRQPTSAEIRTYLDNAGLASLRHPHRRPRQSLTGTVATRCTTRPPVACPPAGRPSWTSPPRSATP